MSGHHKWKDIKRKKTEREDVERQDAETKIADAQEGLRRTADLTRAVIQVPKDEAIEPPRNGSKPREA
jgi:transcriptional/translational regulatory protein YebC/TACO1